MSTKGESTMTTNNEYRCRCDECGEEFDSSEITEINGRPEYSGASTWKESVSPCCFSDFEEIDDL